MFENLGWWEIGALILLALFIFGPDRLPGFIADTAALLRKLRSQAREASAGLRDQLGPDFEIEDLHPKRFVRKHLLSEEDEQLLRRPFDDLVDEWRGTEGEVRSALGSSPASAPEAAARPLERGAETDEEGDTAAPRTVVDPEAT
jgi:sec-independent protein translocase protein TatB